MRTALIVSAALGIIWNVVAVCLMGGKLISAFAPAWAVAGILAGLAAGLFTIWSRRRRHGRETALYGLANYYLAMTVYWIGFVIIERAIMCAREGGWTDFDLHDHLGLIGIFVVYGTLWYGIILIPLNFLSRSVVWKIYQRMTVTHAP